ncbi:MAG: hypothetical protein K5893_02920 [Prevotella sp.]|nr:hypothetical protein [Prevotella sp.]
MKKEGRRILQKAKVLTQKFGWLGEKQYLCTRFGKSDASEDVRRVVMKAAPHPKDVINYTLH